MSHLKSFIHMLTVIMVLLAGQSISHSGAIAQANTTVAPPSAARAISKPSTYVWGTFTQIASGYLHNCALNSTGAAYCWGDNSGKLGNGTTTNSATPIAVTMPTGVSFTAIVAGVSQTCALNTVGAAYCWGGDNYGGLGNGTTGSVSTIPVAVTMPAGVSFSSLTAGNYHTCALTTTGTAYCWGYNSNGQLGNDTYTDSSIPVAVTMPAGVTFTAISAGQSHTCAMTTTGTAYCWGLNIYGQLGKGDSDLGRKTPAAVTMPAGVSFSSLTAGDMHTCALNSGGTAYCWGKNQYGQLGNGTNTNQTVPVAITMPAGDSFTAIKASYHFTCALTNTGNTYCWGENSRGQLGNGSSMGDRNTAGAVTMPASVSFTALSAGSDFACALTNTGTAYCWGGNGYLALGLCDAADRYIPTLVSGCAPAATNTPTASNTSTPSRTNTPTASNTSTPSRTNTPTASNTSTPSRTNTRSATAVPSTYAWGTFTQIASGDSHTCALNSAGVAYCWGSNSRLQLGDGTFTDSATPVAVTMPAGVSFTALSAGLQHTCALNSVGAAYCWGYPGPLGNGTSTPSTTPVAVTMPAGISFTAISAGDYHSCALTTTGTAYCWGSNNRGQLGDGNWGDSSTPVAVTMPAGVSFTAVYAGYESSCALTTTGTAYCWGYNYHGQLGNGTAGNGTNSSTPVAVTMPAGVSFTAVTMSLLGTCALTTTGTIYCWGGNYEGQLGNGSGTNSSTPVAVTMPAGVSFTAVKSGYRSTCALTSTGSAYCWGGNNGANLGNGTFTNSSTPVAVTMPAGVSFTSITSGGYNACAVTTMGTAYCWGYNNAGQIGDCTDTQRTTPTLVSGCAPAATNTPTASNTSTPSRTSTATAVPSTDPWGTFTQISAGSYFTCGLTNTGAIYCWGLNSYGQLGNGTRTDNHSPGPVTMPWGTTFASISAGESHTCALTSTGAIYCWGYNYRGQLGNGTTTDRSTPIAVTMPSGVTFTAISSGSAHTCALTSAGKAYCWGSGWTVGDGAISDRSTPVAVTTPTGITFTAISAGYSQTCGLTNTGAIYCWGFNNYGQLGDGTTTNRSTPVAVTMPSGVTFTEISAGSFYTCGLTNTGATYCWGSNDKAQLGDGTTTNRSTPVAVTMPSGVTFTALNTGWYHTCTLTTTNTAYCWGFNQEGQLGDGTTTDSNAPVAVAMPSGVTFSSFSVGSLHA